jgi:subtilisin family serine protease
MVASMAIGGVNNDRGLSGIAPNCKFMPISLGQEPFTTFSIISGALYAIYQGADVVNLSLGYSLGILAAMPVEQQISLSEQLNLVEEDVWDYVFSLANDRNVMIVWAAGNDNVFVGLDATKRNATTLRVSAVDESLHKAGFSNFGNIAQLHIKETSVSAPGVKIFGACPNNSFATEQGTSFAAPLVTGAVALMKSLNPDLTNTQIIQIIQQTSRPIAGNESIGDLLQIYDALNKVQEMGIRPLQN